VYQVNKHRILKQEGNRILTLHGLDGNIFRKCTPRFELSTIKTSVTAPPSRECQGMLMNATSAGSHFHKTGGKYLNSDDYFISQERKQCRIKYGTLKDKKQEHEDKRIRYEEAQDLIQYFQEKKNKNAYNDIDAQVLLVSELKVLYKCKHGKLSKAAVKKPVLLVDLLTLKDAAEEGEEDTWTPEEEAGLDRLSS